MNTKTDKLELGETVMKALFFLNKHTMNFLITVIIRCPELGTPHQKRNLTLL